MDDDFYKRNKAIFDNHWDKHKDTIKNAGISAATIGLAGVVAYMLLRKDTKRRYLDACDDVIKADGGKACGKMMHIHAELVTARKQLLKKQPDMTEREFNKNILGLTPEERNRVTIAKKLCN